jgi:hypothetical protein
MEERWNNRRLKESCIMRSFVTLTLLLINLNDQVKED